MFIITFLNHTQINKAWVYVMDFRIISIEHRLFKENFDVEIETSVIMKNVKCLMMLVK